MDTNDFMNLVKCRILSAVKNKFSSCEFDFEKFESDLSCYCHEAINKIASDLYNELTKDKQSKLAEYRKDHSEFLDRLNVDWGEGFDLFEIFIAVSQELVSGLLKDSDFSRNDLNMTLIRLQAKGCQVASEILSLMRSGFADGALARWRTLHEIAVVSLFLGKHGIEAARRYIAYDIVESYQIAKKENSCRHKMGYDGPTESELENLKKHADRAKEKFGIEFGEPYGWAAPFIGKRIKFSDIENSVDLEHFRRNYGLASFKVHASIKNITFSFSTMSNSNVILAGATNTGFVEPCHSAAISLQQICPTRLVFGQNSG